MNTPLIEAVEQLAAESAQYVFQEMLGITITRDDPTPLANEPGGQIVGSVGFVGEANGIIHLYAGLSFARTIAARMLSLTEAEIEGDELVNEAMSELSNVMVGRVKSNLCDGGRSCAITVPSVMRGQQLTVGEISEASYRLLGFRNCEHRLLLEVVVKEAQR